MLRSGKPIRKTNDKPPNSVSILRSGRVIRATAKNTKNTKNTKANINNNTRKRKRQPNVPNNMPASPMLKRAAYDPPVPLNIGKAIAFIDYLKTIPMYILLAHSTIRKSTPQIKVKETFAIPKDTFLLSLTNPGEFMCANKITPWFIHNSREEIRKYLHTHSEGNIISRVSAKLAPLFSGIRRAGPNATFPNIVYGFKDYTTDESNPYKSIERNDNGIFPITATPELFDDEANFMNTHSIIKQTEAPDDPDYMLEDIIQTVYKRTGIQKGIFILMGCLAIDDIDYALKTGQRMDIANAEYTAANELLTGDEMYKHDLTGEIPIDFGTSRQMVALNIEDVKYMVKRGLLAKPSNNNSEANWGEENILVSNRPSYREILKGIVPNNNEKVDSSLPK